MHANEPTGSLDAEQCLARAQALMDCSRYADAVVWLQRGLEADPDHALCLCCLAICWINQDGRAARAVEAARQAVSREPEFGFAHAVLALALCHSAKDGQDEPHRLAFQSAEEAVRLDPDSAFAQSTLAQSLLRLKRWPQAETAARKALELDPRYAGAAELLGACLLQQGKHESHEELVQQQLSEHAENASAHSSAGWNALRKGEHQQANHHFMEALRLNPRHEGARLGLVESFRARSWFYRSLLRFNAALNRLTVGRQLAFWLGGYVVYRMLYGALEKRSPAAAGLLVACWLFLVFWTSLGRGLSSLAMLTDRFARQCLRPLEKWEGVVVGGVTVLALGTFVVSFFEPKPWNVLALALFVGALPAASAFTNDHYIGKWFYWAVAVFCLTCSLYPLAGAILALGSIELPVAVWMLPAGFLAAVAFSFIRLFGIGYR